jgi:hypothetical protein
LVSESSASKFAACRQAKGQDDLPIARYVGKTYPGVDVLKFNPKIVFIAAVS